MAAPTIGLIAIALTCLSIGGCVGFLLGSLNAAYWPRENANREAEEKRNG